MGERQARPKTDCRAVRGGIVKPYEAFLIGFAGSSLLIIAWMLLRSAL